MSTDPFATVNQELAKMKPDTMSPRMRRLITMFILIPVSVFVLWTGIRFLLIPSQYNAAREIYDAEQYSTAATQFHSVSASGTAEPYKAYFNSGTSWLKADRTNHAMYDLDMAKTLVEGEGLLAGAYERCAVLSNLALAYNRYGEEQMAIGEYLEAERAFADALATLDVNYCQSQSSMSDEISENQEEAQEQQEQSGGGDSEDESDDQSGEDEQQENSDDSQDDSQQSPSDPKQEELEQRQEDAGGSGSDPLESDSDDESEGGGSPDPVPQW